MDSFIVFDDYSKTSNASKIVSYLKETLKEVLVFPGDCLRCRKGEIQI